MKEIIISVLGGLIVAVLVKAFGLNGGTSHAVVSHQNRASTGAKIAILIGSVGTIYGLLYTSSWLMAGGFNSTQVGYGFFGTLLSLVTLASGRLSAWWSRY